MQPEISHNLNTPRYLYLAVCLLGLYSTSVNALVEYNPIQKKIEQTKDYAQTLNQVASIVMGHYANLVSHQSKQAGNYPKNIQNIQIVDAKLDGLLNQQPQTSFTLTTNIGYLEDQVVQAQQMQESFIFDFKRKPSLVQVNRLKQKELNPENIDAESNANYYLNRQFSYAWLLLLDGHDAPYPYLFDTGSANYQLVIGANKYSGNTQEALKKRTTWMGKGGHLLRNIRVAKTTENSTKLILTIDWKGVTPSNKWSIAKIEQTIDLEKSDQGIYTIINIREQHLLPDIAPWEKILC